MWQCIHRYTYTTKHNTHGFRCHCYLVMASEMDNDNESSSSKLQARKTVLVVFSCSICLEAISEESCERSIAKLKCGHRFHLGKIKSLYGFLYLYVYVVLFSMEGMFVLIYEQSSSSSSWFLLSDPSSSASSAMRPPTFLRVT